MLASRALVLLIVLLGASCAPHRPERAARVFIGWIGRPATGLSAFDQVSHALQLHEEPEKPSVYRKAATWDRKENRIALVTSNVLRDDPARYDLRLSWTPSRLLKHGLPERLLGPPSGTSATGDAAWVLPGGGVLEYRHIGIDTPYLLYSSPGFIREPLDFVQTIDGAKLPTLTEATKRLQALGAPEPTERSEIGFRSRRFCIGADACVTLYVTSARQRPDYLIGLGLTLGGTPEKDALVRILHELGVADAEELVKAGAASKLVVKGNFAIETSTDTLTLWSRIEMPVSWCRVLRPDLERCK